jgi:hypothetical protein
MVNEEQKIRLIHEYRTDLLDRMFGKLGRNAPGCSTGHITREIVAVAMRIRAAMAKADEITCSSRGLFVLGFSRSLIPLCRSAHRRSRRMAGGKTKSRRLDGA